MGYRMIVDDLVQNLTGLASSIPEIWIKQSKFNLGHVT